MKLKISTFLLLLCLVVPTQADQDGVIVRLAPVYTDASSISQRVGKISAGTRVSIFERKGGWKQVFSEEKSIIGWVRSFQVREGSYTAAPELETSTDSRGFLTGLAAFSRKASGFFKTDGSRTSSSTATIGVRGLSEEEIKSASADFEEFEKMQGFSSDSKRMPAFTSQGGLRAQQVAHIAGTQ